MRNEQDLADDVGLFRLEARAGGERVLRLKAIALAEKSRQLHAVREARDIRVQSVIEALPAFEAVVPGEAVQAKQIAGVQVDALAVLVGKARLGAVIRRR